MAATSPHSTVGTPIPITEVIPPFFSQSVLRSSKSKRVYLAGPIGAGGSEHNGPWRDEARAYLENKGLIVVEPLEASKYHLYEVDETDDTVAKILTERDRRFSMESDYILANFTGSIARSIGTCIELGWADAAGTTIVTVLPDDDEHHRHPILESVSDYTVDKLSKACEIISSLAADRVEDM